MIVDDDHARSAVTASRAHVDLVPEWATLASTILAVLDAAVTMRDVRMAGSRSRTTPQRNQTFFGARLPGWVVFWRTSCSPAGAAPYRIEFSSVFRGNTIAISSRKARHSVGSPGISEMVPAEGFSTMSSTPSGSGGAPTSRRAQGGNPQSSSIDVAEQRRLNDAREAGIPWKKWGPYLSERQWGTVREDYSDVGQRLELLYPRSIALARLSLGRRRPRRHLGRWPAALLRARALERT